MTEIHNYYAELYCSVGNDNLATKQMLVNLDRKLTEEDKNLFLFKQVMA